MGNSVGVDELFSLAIVDYFPGCGKTQLGHTMAVIAQLPKVFSSPEHINN
jgi:hypothetical protein